MFRNLVDVNLSRTILPVQRGTFLNQTGSQKRGYLNHTIVVGLCFWVITLCILVAVVASILAIWEFTGTDGLWRTVATCSVIGVGTLLFAAVNRMFGGSGPS